MKQTIWGGDKIAKLKHLTPQLDGIGESWELSGLKGCETVCLDGSGRSLNDMVACYGERLVGKNVYERFGNVFPILVKFIDAKKDLSVQVHPDEDMALKNNLQNGKTEMWYALPSSHDALLYCGLRHPVTHCQFRQMVQDGTLCDILASYHVAEGDVFFVPAGRIHAIGAGCLLVEIQQTCDITYRIYDYGRKNKDGEQRQLHLQEALEAIDLSVKTDYRTYYDSRKNQPCELVSCPYFVTSVYDITKTVRINHKQLDSFVILIGLSGEIVVSTIGHATILHSFETILIPAENREVKLDGVGKVLEVHCP